MDVDVDVDWMVVVGIARWRWCMWGGKRSIPRVETGTGSGGGWSQTIFWDARVGREVGWWDSGCGGSPEGEVADVVLGGRSVKEDVGLPVALPDEPKALCPQAPDTQTGQPNLGNGR